jgi:RHS repeat-associated protein
VFLLALFLVVGAGRAAADENAAVEEGNSQSTNQHPKEAGTNADLPEASEPTDPVAAEEHFFPTAAQTRSFLESGEAKPLVEAPETNLHAAQNMPHRDLERGRALELAEAVFEPELESPAGIYGEIEPERYLSDFAAVVPASSIPGEPDGSPEAEGPPLEHPDEPVLIESMLPLRTKNSSGEEEAVDLELEPTEGELQPRNPLTEVGVPGHLGEGISLPDAEVGVTVAGAPGNVAPTNAGGSYAFYPDVAADTDLIVAPTAQGVETMTDVRSAEAPMQTTYDLEFPAGGELRPDGEGGAEVVEGDEVLLVIPAPSSIDAAGEPVPTELSVSGQGVTVGIEPGPSTAFPVLVDPTYIAGDSLEEFTEWTFGHESMSAWEVGSSTNQTVMADFPWEYWDHSYPGLDISSGLGGWSSTGVEANWEYHVPRYRSDFERYGIRPTTWVGRFAPENVQYWTDGTTAAYPALILGLVDIYSGWVPGDWVHYGNEGDLHGYNSGEVDPVLANGTDTNVKKVDMELFTAEGENPGRRRDTYMGAASVWVMDQDAPQVLGLSAPPSGWLTGSTPYTVGYSLQDTGLGVSSAGMRVQGEEAFRPGWEANFNCQGTVASPCPRDVGSGESGRPKLTFSPNQLPTGRDTLEVQARDPLGTGGAGGHVASGTVPVKVDNTPPEISLSGPLYEHEEPGAVTPPSPGLVAAYAFNEGEGSTIEDVSGNGHTGTIEGAGWTSHGRYGGALEFSGEEGECVTVPDSRDLQLNEEFTLEAWVRPSAPPGEDPIIFKEHLGEEGWGNVGYALELGVISDDRPEGFIGEGGGNYTDAGGNSSIESEVWTHLAFTYDGTHMRVYENGELAGENTQTTGSLAAGGPMKIGCNDWNDHFDGRIDEIRVYDRALSEGEIQGDRSAPLQTPKNGPVAAWSFDEGEGTTVEDATGNGHEGTIEGAEWTTGRYGEALRFVQNEGRQCVKVADSPDLRLEEEFTLEAWVRPEEWLGSSSIISKELEPESGQSYSLGIGFTEYGRVEGWSENEVVYSPAAIEEDVWTHVAYTYDGENARIYLDGELVSDKAVGPRELASTGPLDIGCDAPSLGAQFFGRIDEVEIYDRALDAGEVAADQKVEPQTANSLQISVHDGSEDEAQSGVSKVELKVDGKDVALPEKPWSPECKTENCSASGTWTMAPSRYTPGHHEIEVVATDAVGLSSTTTMEVELGEEPLQTSFTTPHPTYAAGEISSIGFKATKAGVPVSGATFRCSLDGSGEAPTTPCTSPYALPEHITSGWHVMKVAAVDKEGSVDPTPATWKFKAEPYPAAPATEKLVYPEVGKETASYYTLEAQWGGNPEDKAGTGVTGVTFQMELPGWKVFKTVPVECTIDGKGRQVSWPLPVHSHPGHSAPVYLRVRGCAAFEEAGYPEKEIQFRAVFDGSEAVAGASAPATTEFVSRANANRVSTDATESVGPASVDLLTGAFTISRTDVSIPVPGYEANLEFTRTYSSTFDRSLKGASMVLGGVWQPGSPLEAESEGSAWSRIVERVIPYHAAVYEDVCWEDVEEEEVEIACPSERCTIAMCEEGLVEEEQPEQRWIELIDDEGVAVVFEIAGANYVAPEYAKELKLTRQEGNLVLAYPNGNRNIFVSSGQNEWRPKYVSFQSSPASMRLVYEEGAFGGMKLVREIAPSPVECQPFESEGRPGCRTLAFEYETFYLKGYIAPRRTEKLVGITYYGPNGDKAAGTKVARYTYTLSGTEWPCYEGTCSEWEVILASEYDPRLPNLVERYSYDEKPGHSNLLSGLEAPGQEPWGFEYEYGTAVEWMNSGTPSRLKAVTRAGTKTTLAYGVPVHGPGAPYDMSAENIAGWGQTDLPVDATAIFPPTHVPSEYPPHEYTGATIHYMDPEGYEVNTASPSPPGVTGASITTTETDMKGDVVRELTPRNRLAALAVPDSVAASHELDSHSVYNAAGTEILESWGPLHEVRLESGEIVEARRHTITHYDEGEPAPPVGTPPAYLPTKETVAAVVAGRKAELEPRITETRYNWTLRLPTETIVDPGGLDIRSVTVYNGLGQVEESRQPKGAGGGTAGDTRTVYYSASGKAKEECKGRAQYANLPCKVLPAKQASGTGRSELVVKKFLAYDDLDEPTEVTESPNGGAANVRKTVTVYDGAGRQVSTKITGGGTALARTEARTETIYSPTLGVPQEQKFVCEGDEAECTGFDSQATTTKYNSLGQVEKYVDADGNETETTYDAYGRPSTVTDPRGTETLHYDEASGVLTSMDVSDMGTFTATYDADGDLIERGLPNGLTARTTYNQAGEPTRLSYAKTSSCGESCTWYEEALERSIEGRIISDDGSLVQDHYAYDKAGRLTEAQETPTEGQCTSRAYTYDGDSNRLTKTTRSPGVGGACATSGGTTQKYEYDEADRLIGPTYDAWGRIISLPAEFAGGKALTTEYFANDMVATQTQNGVTNTFQLDATGRQRQREQTGGVAGVEVFHYDGPGDSPSWTSLGSTWTRNIPGIGGELAAVQESSGTTIFKLTDLHGDVVASASSSPTATKLLATYRFDEFGEPESEGAGRFGWLGGKARRTELPSGVIQMGARSYIPQLGRFLTPDPVPGGSANPYDYADQDPINNFDLGGEKCSNGQRPGHGKCDGPPTPKKIRQAAKRRTRQIAAAHHLANPVVKSRKCTAAACRVGWPSGGPHNTGSIEHIASAIVGFLVKHSAPTIRESHEFLETWSGSGGYSNEAILGCAKGATEAWQETAGARVGDPAEIAMGTVASALYSAVKCGVAAL